MEHNRQAWNRQVQEGNRWTLPVSPEEVEEARAGLLKLVLTPQKPVPPEWLGQVEGASVLCLASGGGQQAPLLAAAGAQVTLLDLSDAQLAQDRKVAEREGLEIRLEQGDMRDLSRFADESFDLIFHPVSNCFVPEIEPVWQEAFRVLRGGGELLAGFANPALFIFEYEALKQGRFEVKYPVPYADTDYPDQEAKQLAAGEPLEFGHLLEDQIGGQLRAGFHLIDFYEDADPTTALATFLPTFQATRARKPAHR